MVIVNTLCLPRHTLSHPSRSQLCPWNTLVLLDPNSTGEQGVSVRVPARPIQRLQDRALSLASRRDKGDDSPVDNPIIYSAEVKV